MKRKRIIIVACLIGALLGGGCASQIKFTNSGTQAAQMKAGQAYIAPMDGWYITDESLMELLMTMEYFRLMWMKCQDSRS